MTLKPRRCADILNLEMPVGEELLRQSRLVIWPLLMAIDQNDSDPRLLVHQVADELHPGMTGTNDDDGFEAEVNFLFCLACHSRRHLASLSRLNHLVEHRMPPCRAIALLSRQHV